MNIKFGENQIENIAVKVNGIKEKDTIHVEKQSFQEQVEKQEKKMSREGVVLELSKMGVQTSAMEEVNEKISNKEEIEAKKQIEAIQKLAVTPNKILENINI